MAKPLGGHYKKTISETLYEAFVSAAVDAHVGWLLYEAEVIQRSPSLKATHKHLKEFTDCENPTCKVRAELADKYRST
jgi:hypothetical protein